ncbi:MAG: methyl-accepting chemotaxis protein [bacterium]
MSTKQSNRKLLLINPRMQIKYIFIVICCFILVALWLTWDTYFFLKGVISDNNPELINDLIQTFVFMCGKIVILTIIFAFLGLYLSNRIAGPVYKLTQKIKLIADTSDLTVCFPLRKNDELKDLAHALNHLISTFRDRLIHENSFREKVRITSNAVITLLNNKHNVTREEKEKLIKAGTMLLKESSKDTINFKV